MNSIVFASEVIHLKWYFIQRTAVNIQYNKQVFVDIKQVGEALTEHLYHIGAILNDIARTRCKGRVSTTLLCTKTSDNNTIDTIWPNSKFRGWFLVIERKNISQWRFGPTWSVRYRFVYSLTGVLSNLQKKLTDRCNNQPNFKYSMRFGRFLTGKLISISKDAF